MEAAVVDHTTITPHPCPSFHRHGLLNWHGMDHLVSTLNEELDTCFLLGFLGRGLGQTQVSLMCLAKVLQLSEYGLNLLLNRKTRFINFFLAVVKHMHMLFAYFVEVTWTVEEGRAAGWMFFSFYTFLLPAVLRVMKITRTGKCLCFLSLHPFVDLYHLVFTFSNQFLKMIFAFSALLSWYLPDRCLIYW